MYYLANNTYAQQWDELDISLPGTVDGNALTNTDNWSMTLYAESTSMPASVYIAIPWLEGIHFLASYSHTDLGSSYADKIFCYAAKTNSRANKLCKNLAGADGADWGDGYRYTIK